jgi:hypothetical protein
MHLLEQALARSQWREAFGTPMAVEDGSSADEDRVSRKPRYLN